jgi:transcription factor CON7
MFVEFKEIRKEWKAKKKEEEAQRKADDERHRQGDRNPQEGPSEAPVYGHIRTTPLGPPPSMGGPQLPPIGYAPAASGQSQPSYGAPSPAIEGMAQYGSRTPLFIVLCANTSNSYPPSPYAPGNQMYQQR